MTVQALLARARARHLSVMVDLCEVSRPGVRVFDPDSGGYTAGSSVLYSGPCRLRGVPAGERQAGDAEQVVARPLLQLPYAAGTAADIRPGDTAVVGGTLWTVVSRLDSTTATAASFTVEEVQP